MIQLQEINKYYGKIHALRDLTLALVPGSVGLLGPNGAGKSTLLKIVLGLIEPSSGKASVLELDPSQHSLELRQRVGYMPERDCHLAGLDAVEFCTFAAQLSGLPQAEAKQRAHAVLEFVGLEDKRYLKVQTYSTGQKQRVKLAQALVHDPDILLLDEPTNGLDPAGRDEMLQLIDALPKRRRCSVILSSHLLADVEAVCQHILVLSEGQLLFDGPLSQLRGEERSRYQVRVKDKSQELMIQLCAAGAQVKLEDGALVIDLPKGTDPDLIFSCAQRGSIQIRHLAPYARNLERAFLDVINQRGQG
jgi:ABC-2 type transport system ATP-binding protein